MRIRDALDTAIRANVAAVRTAVVCTVRAYDRTTHRADVSPVHKTRLNTGVYVPAETVFSVPAPPLSWGNFVIHAPYSVGDQVVVLVHERSLDEWLSGGGTELEPADPRRHSLVDGIVLTRIDPDGQGPTAGADDTLTIGTRDGSVRLEITGSSVAVTSGDIRLGSGSASDPVALSSLVAAELSSLQTKINQMITIFNSHTHPVTAVGSPTGPSATPMSPQAVPGSVEAGKVTAE